MTRWTEDQQYYDLSPVDDRPERRKFMKVWLGIDPGMTGAMAVIWSDGKTEVHDFDDASVYDLLRALGCLVETRAVIEKGMVMPKQGISSSGKFMMNYGIWQGRLEMAGIPFDVVTPQKWKKVMFDSSPKADPKEMARQRAIHLFPSMAGRLTRKKDHGRAESLLIAEFCRRMDVGLSNRPVAASSPHGG